MSGAHQMTDRVTSDTVPASPVRAEAPQPATPATVVLEHLLHELSFRERLVVSLRFADDLSVLEIASVLHASTDEVERIIAHAVTRVRSLTSPV